MMVISRGICLSAALLSASLLLPLLSRAEDAVTDWKAVIALDAGPQEHPKTAEAARAVVLAHLARQEKALHDFIVSHPQDEHAFEARLRLARLYQYKGDMEDSDKLRTQSREMLAELDKYATPSQRADLDFSKVTQYMRSMKQATQRDSEELLALARKFQAAHPDDRRVASLLAEVATIFDDQPRTKQALLEDAQRVATDPETKGRIADDLKRVGMLGQVVPFRFTPVQGREMSLEDYRGKPVILFYFADFSLSAPTAAVTIQRAVLGLPKDSVQVVGISLDNNKEELTRFVQAHNITWPVIYDGKGWESPLVRPLGINALPTVWLIDQQGRLRSLNALEGLSQKVRLLLGDRP